LVVQHQLADFLQRDVTGDLGVVKTPVRILLDDAFGLCHATQASRTYCAAPAAMLHRGVQHFGIGFNAPRHRRRCRMAGGRTTGWESAARTAPHRPRTRRSPPASVPRAAPTGRSVPAAAAAACRAAPGPAGTVSPP